MEFYKLDNCYFAVDNSEWYELFSDGSYNNVNPQWDEAELVEEVPEEFKEALTNLAGDLYAPV